MQTFNLKDGGHLDIPVSAILMVEELAGKEKGCTILYSLKPGENINDQLTNTYGSVKKRWLDETGADTLEVTTATETPRKVCFLSQFVVARREVADAPHAARLKLTLNINGPTIDLLVKDSRDSVVGAEENQ